MKKPIIAIIALLVLAAASITAFLLVKNNEDKKAEEAAAKAADYVLMNFSSDDITNASFTFDGDSYNAELIEEEWTFTSSEDFILNHTYVQGVCTYMSTLTAEKDYGEATDESKAMYGLDDPTVITLSDGASEHTIYVGDLDPTSTYYYVMVPEKTKIYAISASDGSTLKTTRVMMRDTYLVPYIDNEVARIQVIKNDETVYDLTLNTETNLWELPEEYSDFNVAQTAVTTIVSYLTRAQAQEFFEENLEDLSTYGFDEPAAELIVTGTDGKEYRLLFSYFGNNTNTYTHVLYENGQVAVFYTGDVDLIECTPADFLVQEICNISVFDITGFDYSYEEHNDVFTVDMDNSITKMNDKYTISEMGDTATTAFTNFYNSITYIAFDELDFEAQPDKSELVLRVNFHLADGSDTLFELYKADEKYSYIFIDGEYTGGITITERVTGQNSVSYFYNKLMDILEP
ncbi:MAG: DUF4340 domain-containing protein [Ruminococcus sp.]|nr:DUF4340 domain-containing protein [Ruminococcus sp.]